MPGATAPEVAVIAIAAAAAEDRGKGIAEDTDRLTEQGPRPSAAVSSREVAGPDVGGEHAHQQSHSHNPRGHGGGSRDGSREQGRSRAPKVLLVTLMIRPSLPVGAAEGGAADAAKVDLVVDRHLGRYRVDET